VGEIGAGAVWGREIGLGGHAGGAHMQATVGAAPLRELDEAPGWERQARRACSAGVRGLRRRLGGVAHARRLGRAIGCLGQGATRGRAAEAGRGGRGVGRGARWAGQGRDGPRRAERLGHTGPRREAGRAGYWAWEGVTTTVVAR
jgi:hypothetical protein